LNPAADMTVNSFKYIFYPQIKDIYRNKKTSLSSIQKFKSAQKLAMFWFEMRNLKYIKGDMIGI